MTNHGLAGFIRVDFPNIVSGALTDDLKFLEVKGSHGQGRWTEVPWLACFYPVVTRSATMGYYVVYLFDIATRTVFLSLNQGTTSVEREFGRRRSIEILSHRAALMHERILDLAPKLGSEQVTLSSNRPMCRGYEAGSAYAKAYSMDLLPDDEQLTRDLNAFCHAYLVLQFRGGLAPSGGNGDSEQDRVDEVIETRRYKFHRRIERSSHASKLAKKGREAICEVCAFNFAKFYGEVGDGYIEAHHKKPLSSLREGEAVAYKASDFALLCSNCHKMIHKLSDPSDVNRLKQLVESHG